MLRRLLSLAGLAALGWIGWMLLTSLAPGSAVAGWAPCPRNWGWIDAWTPRRSPLDSAAIRFSRGQAKICYGRPSLRGRKMLGGEAVPFGRLWRTGANEATTLHVNVPVQIGSLFLIPGSYSIYTVPDERSWQVILNRSARQWGLESLYDDERESQEVGRLPVPVETLESPVETFTISTQPSGDDDWWIVLEWQTTRVRIPITTNIDNERDEDFEDPLPADDSGASVLDTD